MSSAVPPTPASAARRRGLRRALTGYELAVVVPLAAWLSYEAIRRAGMFARPALLFWIVAIAVVDLMPVGLTGGVQMSLSFPIELAVAILYGPVLAAFITLFGSFDPRELKGKIRPLKATFIRAQVAWSIAAESAVFHTLGELHSPWYRLAPAVLAAIAAGYLVNALCVAFYLRMDSGVPLRQGMAAMHVGSPREFLLSYVGLSLFGLVTAQFFLHEGLWSVVVFVGPLVFGRQMYFKSRALSDRLTEQNGLLAEQARQLQQHLDREQNAVAELRELNRMKSEFVAVASHELRTPLTTIIGYAKTLRRPEFTGDAALREEFLATMERQGDRLLRLVENLLAASNVEHDRKALSLDSVDLSDLIRGAVEALGANASRVRLEVASDIPVLITDGDKLTRILMNLLDNALKYSPPASASEVHATRSGEWVSIEVRDQGIGIESAELGRIFDRFYQADSSPTRSFNGVGLGLSLVKELVEVLGATIEVSSDPGVGSVFTVGLPFMHPSVEAGSFPTLTDLVASS